MTHEKIEQTSTCSLNQAFEVLFGQMETIIHYVLNPNPHRALEIEIEEFMEELKEQGYSTWHLQGAKGDLMWDYWMKDETCCAFDTQIKLILNVATSSQGVLTLEQKYQLEVLERLYGLLLEEGSLLEMGMNLIDYYNQMRGTRLEVRDFQI